MKTIDGTLLLRIFISAGNHLLNNKEEVNSLNVFPVPDGDTGTNMSLTMESALRRGKSAEQSGAGVIAKEISKGALMGARGNSGVILSQLLRGFSEGVGNRENISIPVLALAFKKASETAYRAVMNPTEGTILTVAREAADHGLRIYKKYSNMSLFLEEVIHAAKISLENTPKLLPVLAEAHVVDAGGRGLVLLLEGALAALNGRDIPSDTGAEGNLQSSATRGNQGTLSTDDIQFGYCTEFMVHADEVHVEHLKDQLLPLGDSQLVVGSDGLIKVHLHTNHPGKAMEYGLALGALQDIKVDNMRFQHEEILLRRELLDAGITTSKKVVPPVENPEEEKEFSFVAVSMGEGISRVFEDLGVEEVVFGGQTMNPSTEDLLQAVNRVPGKEVFILPNNSNIILAAEQAKKLSDKKVYVLPSKTVPEGVSALMAFQQDLSGPTNLENMTEAMKDVLTAQVTYAVRDTQFGDRKIEKGDLIGLCGKEIAVSGHDLSQVTMSLVQEYMNEDITLLSLYRGKDVDEEEAGRLVELLEEEFEDVDIELIDGGQPLYYYIVSME